MTKPVIALVGAGMMGANHARIITASNIANLGVVIDLDPAAAERLADSHWVRHDADLAAAERADAVVVASATSSHLAIALRFLEAGLPVFVEKPLAPTLTEVDELLALADAKDLPIMCGFVERFNPAFRTALSVISGPVHHITTVRHSAPAPRISSSVVSDLLLHDLDLVLQIVGDDGVELLGSGVHRPGTSKFSEIADCVLRYEGGLANLSANRVSQNKARDIRVHSAGCTLEVDLLRQDVTVYRHVSQDVSHHDGGHSYRSSTEIEIPFVRHSGEPLALQFAHFVALIEGRSDHDAERASIRPAHQLMGDIDRSAPALSAERLNDSSAAS